MMKDMYTESRKHIYALPQIEELGRDVLEFALVKDRQGRGWLYSLDAKVPASQIYCTDSANWDKAGEGFAGATLTFRLVTGEEFKLRGGGHSNADSLFAHTGVDLRNLYASIIHIWSKDGKSVYEEMDWVMGQYDRTKEVLKSLGLENDMVYVAHRTTEGGSFGWRNYHA